jgi:hypothetical protein
MAREIEYDGKVHEFPDDATDAEIRSALGGTQPATATPPTEGVVMDTLRKFAPQTAKDVVAIGELLQGFTSGAANTLVHGPATLMGLATPLTKQLATAPDTPMGQAGRFIEQGAEFMIPGMGAAKGAALLKNAPRVAQVLGRAGMEAAGAGTLAAIQSGGDPEAARNAALLGGGISAVTGALPLVAPALKEAASTQYARVLNPTKEKTKAIAAKIRPEMLSRGMWAGSLPRMLESTQSRLGVLGQQIDDAWEAMNQAGVQARIEPLLTRLDDFSTDAFHGTTPSGKLAPLGDEAVQAAKEVEGIKKHIIGLSEVDPATGERVITSDSFLRLRRFWDKVADQAGAHQKDLNSWIPAEINKEAADIARSELAKARPDLAAINKEFSLHKDMETVLKSTIGRRVGQQKPLTRQLMKASGVAAGSSVGGPIGAVIGSIGMDQLQGLVSSAAWGTLSAVGKNKLAEALARGERGPALFYLNQLLRTAGMPMITKDREPTSTPVSNP